MPEHTPGPWVRDGTIWGAGSLQIDLRLDDEGDNWISVKGPDAEANVLLVGAAPDVYVAAERLVANTVDHPKPQMDGGKRCCLVPFEDIEALCVAIAKVGPSHAHHDGQA